jgi:hypothetical protein
MMSDCPVFFTVMPPDPWEPTQTNKKKRLLLGQERNGSERTEQSSHDG